MTVLEHVYKILKDSVKQSDRRIDTLEQNTETSGSAFQLRELTLSEANTEIPDITGWAYAIITDGRKNGEGAGFGTGCPAYLDQGQTPAVWLRFSDDSAVAT